MIVGETTWRGELVVSVTPITGQCQETPEQEKAREKAGKPAPLYSYTAISVKSGAPWE
jgi:hypothetical protein